jgi:hypothetical protein
MPAAAPIPLRPAASVAAPAPAPVSASAANAASASSTMPSTAAKQPVLTMPRIDESTLPASLGPMVEAIRLYDALLVEENALLTSGDSKGVAALLDRKMSATRLYQERLRAVLADSAGNRALPAEQRSTVVAMIKCLEARAKENTVLLKANMGAIEQLFEVINTAARKMRKREVAYSKAGRICDSYSPHSVSLAYNQSI